MRLLLAVLLVGCASAKPAPRAPGPEPEEMGKAADSAPASCDEACTEVAICWEEVHDAEYGQGASCVEVCGENEAAYLRCVSEAADCAAMLDC